MSILSLIFEPFYSVEVRESEQQLHRDFGEYPPKPLLQRNKQKLLFNVVRVRGIGKFFSFIRKMKIHFRETRAGTETR